MIGGGGQLRFNILGKTSAWLCTPGDKEDNFHRLQSDEEAGSLPQGKDNRYRSGYPPGLRENRKISGSPPGDHQ